MVVWLQLWPNLAANVLWVPIALAWHRWAVGRHVERAIARALMTSESGRLADARQHLERLLAQNSDEP